MERIMKVPGHEIRMGGTPTARMTGSSWPAVVDFDGIRDLAQIGLG
jgi:hypothetical protein